MGVEPGMREEMRRYWDCAVLSVFVTIAIVCVCTLIGGLPLFREQPAAWAGALGTIAAFIGTILIATSDARRRRRDAIDLAVLTCSELNVQLEFLFDHLESIKTLNTDAPGGSSTTWKLKAEAISAGAQWSEEQLARLICVGKGVAGRMALSKGLIGSGTHRLRSYADLLGSGQEFDMKSKCVYDLQVALDNLLVAGDQLFQFRKSHTDS